ncbi:uncharacterized protein A4U43_C07F3440 [Asparagus officinalis]|uniref:Ribosomal protein L10 n=1 Tax=Asparagus officinalis TaxID=4686 RepID=A0A5P1E916_ASPOF|nr:uncharacterized protein A4U43_C07F3440 [Asparagus officinalis]
MLQNGVVIHQASKLGRPSPIQTPPSLEPPVSSSSPKPPLPQTKPNPKKKNVVNPPHNLPHKACHFIAGLYCNGLSTKQLQNLRASLPPSAKLVVAKNSLVEQALKGTKWETLTVCATGMNAWLFVHDDDGIPAALRPCREFQKKEGVGFNDFRGAVFEGRVYGPEEFGELETMPTEG